MSTVDTRHTTHKDVIDDRRRQLAAQRAEVHRLEEVVARYRRKGSTRDLDLAVRDLALARAEYERMGGAF